jgi:hypothetical protein
MEYPCVAVTGGPSFAATAALAPFDARHACALLDADPDGGLRYTVRGLGVAAPVADDPAWPELLRLLSRNPFVAALRARSHGYAGDPPVTEAALASHTDPAAAGAPRSWLAQHSTICRALRSRTLHLAQVIDATAAHVPGALITGIAAGYAPELRLSIALRDGRARATLLEPDARACSAAARLSGGLPVTTRRATLADMLSGAGRVHGSALIYVPTLAEHLPLETLGELLGALSTGLAPGGSVLMPFYTAVPEAGFLRWIGGWQPHALPAPLLKHQVAGIDGVVSQIEHDPVPGLAYLTLRRITNPGKARAASA